MTQAARSGYQGVRVPIGPPPTALNDPGSDEIDSEEDVPPSPEIDDSDSQEDAVMAGHEGAGAGEVPPWNRSEDSHVSNDLADQDAVNGDAEDAEHEGDSDVEAAAPEDDEMLEADAISNPPEDSGAGEEDRKDESEDEASEDEEMPEMDEEEDLAGWSEHDNDANFAVGFPDMDAAFDPQMIPPGARLGSNTRRMYQNIINGAGPDFGEDVGPDLGEGPALRPSQVHGFTAMYPQQFQQEDQQEDVHRDWGRDDPGQPGNDEPVSTGAGVFDLPDDLNSPDSWAKSGEGGQGDLKWQKVVFAGEGTFGTVSIWILYDTKTGDVHDRMAIKDVHIPADRWSSPGYWPNHPVHDAPAEVAAMRTLCREPKCPFIIDYRGFRNFGDELHSYRIAMEAAEFGDVSNLAKRTYLDKATGRPKHPKDHHSLPAEFLLDMLAAWMTAGQHMLSRNLSHNDWKGANILLVQDKEGAMRTFAHKDHINDIEVGYGIVPKFTDFGVSLPMSSQVFVNPISFLRQGTTGFRPPEMVTPDMVSPELEKLVSILDQGEERTLVGEPATVFGIAATFFHTLHAKSLTRLPAFARDKTEGINCRDLFDDVRDNEAEDVENIFSHFAEREDDVVLDGGASNASYIDIQETLIHCLRQRPERRVGIPQCLEWIREKRPRVAQRPLSRELSSLISAGWARDFPLFPEYNPNFFQHLSIYQDVLQQVEEEKARKAEEEWARKAEEAARLEEQQRLEGLQPMGNGGVRGDARAASAGQKEDIPAPLAKTW